MRPRPLRATPTAPARARARRAAPLPAPTGRSGSRRAAAPPAGRGAARRPAPAVPAGRAHWFDFAVSNWSFPSNQSQHTLVRVASSPTLRGSLLAATALALVGSLVAAADLVEGYPFAAGQALRYAAAALALLAIARGRLPRLRPPELLGLGALSATGLVLFNLFVIDG